MKENEIAVITEFPRKVKEIENIVGDKIAEGIERVRLGPVSYTHLTLPPSDLE